MEGPAREMNLMDIAGRVEKILCEAEQIRARATEAGDILAGCQASDASQTGAAPQPSALLHRISQSLGTLEKVQHDQRQALNRIHNSLVDGPQGTPGQCGTVLSPYNSQTIAAQKQPQNGYR